MDKLDELEKKLKDADKLIGDILDAEPKKNKGEYGKLITAICNESNWIDFCGLADHR